MYDINDLAMEELDAQFDEICSWFRENYERTKDSPAVVSTLKLKQFQFAHAILIYLTQDTSMKVNTKMFKPFKSMASITVEGSFLHFSALNKLAKAMSFASNVEFYPKTNGKIIMTLTFHGIADVAE